MINFSLPTRIDLNVSLSVLRSFCIANFNLKIIGRCPIRIILTKISPIAFYWCPIALLKATVIYKIFARYIAVVAVGDMNITQLAISLNKSVIIIASNLNYLHCVYQYTPISCLKGRFEENPLCFCASLNNGFMISPIIFT